MSNTRFTSPSVTATTKSGKAIPIAQLKLLVSSEHFKGMGPDAVRLARAYENVMNFYYEGVFKTQLYHGKALRDDIENNAPYDYQELDDYHMKENMTIKAVGGRIDGVPGESDGVEIESEAPYSGLLEYGTARHGIQYVFFRPAVEMNQREYKQDVIIQMRRALSV